MTAPTAPTTTPPAVSVGAQMRPADIARAINDKLSQMVSAARTSFTRAIEIGELLHQAKSRVGHGNFEAWVNDHCQLSYRSARRYMKLADDRPKIEAAKMANVANLNVATAQRLLAPPKSPEEKKPKPPATDQYKQIETALIDCLKGLREKAETCARALTSAGFTRLTLTPCARSSSCTAFLAANRASTCTADALIGWNVSFIASLHCCERGHSLLAHRR